MCALTKNLNFFVIFLKIGSRIYNFGLATLDPCRVDMKPSLGKLIR